MSQSESNAYLGEVLEQQQKVDMELKRKVRAPSPSQMAASRATPVPAPARAAQRFQQTLGEMQTETFTADVKSVDYRITGWWRWKTVVVPPNVYVVHTRRGIAKPLHIGMGVSFRYNPYTDAFLVIPAAMQTIVINARCICVERQGILVQAYVQWIIDDIETAFRKLDFSDAEDPMRIVNVQLREQAEAAIKDKVATLKIDEVLADKQPIIEELTHRLRTVAEGSRDGGTSGLGLKIVTVQIKEAVVSSTKLWENLQTPFRAERERVARMAALETARQVAERELEIREKRETAEINTERELMKQRSLQEREVYDRAQGEAERRAKVEQEAERKAVLERNATEKAKREAELELTLKSLELAREKVQGELQTLAEQKKLDLAVAERLRAKTEGDLTLEELKSKARALIAERDTEGFRARREVENDLSDSHVRAQMIEALPEIASKLPAPAELKSVNISSDGTGGAASSLTALLASLLALVEGKEPAAKSAKTPRAG